MQVARQPKNPEDSIRYKTITQLENQAANQLVNLINGYDNRVALIPEELRTAAAQELRVLAQQAILLTFENRIPQMEKDFGYEWESGLETMNTIPERETVASLFLSKLPGLDKRLHEPVVKQRIAAEWLYHQTADRFDTFTPYLTAEEEELQRWKESCPDAYNSAYAVAQKAALKVQDRSRPTPGTPPSLDDNGKDLSYLAHMISARKLYMAATDSREFFDTQLPSADVTVPSIIMTGNNGEKNNKIYCKLGLNPRPFAYAQATESQMQLFRSLISPTNQVLNNLQEKVVPWVSKKGMSQKLHPNLMAQVYFDVIKPGRNVTNPDVKVEEALGGARTYKMLGFVSELSNKQMEVFSTYIEKNPALQEFINTPAVMQEMIKNQIDTSLVSMALSDTIVRVLPEEFKAYSPNTVIPEGDPKKVSLHLVKNVIDDLRNYHSALLEQNHLSIRNGKFFKSFMEKQYEQNLPPKVKAKRESFYQPVAVALAAKPDPTAGPVPGDWKALGEYTDTVTGMQFTDYEIHTTAGKAIGCLAKGANPQVLLSNLNDLLELNAQPLINNRETRVKGVRVSELFYNELKASCLRPISIARAQFYTTFSFGEAMRCSKGLMEKPTMEMVVESLKPCAVFRYNEKYSRLKPAEMVRVKYRTPTGEATNPCWDASQAVCGLTTTQIKERLEDPKWTLVMIEGEKKAAMLAQMAQDCNLPFHIVAIPGVWMAMTGPKDHKVLSPFFDQFKMEDDKGNHRKCMIFFDNDKAFNVNVTQALLQTAECLQRKGGDVFVPNLPFGKRIKGADDFAQVYCRHGEQIDYKPLIDVMQNSVYIPIRTYPIKAQTPDQQRKAKRFLAQAEHVKDIQDKFQTLTPEEKVKAAMELICAQGNYLLQVGQESKVIERFEALDPKNKEKITQQATTENFALKNLKLEMEAFIPNFDQGTSYSQAIEAGSDFDRYAGTTTKTQRPVTEELFAWTQ